MSDEMSTQGIEDADLPRGTRVRTAFDVDGAPLVGTIRRRYPETREYAIHWDGTPTDQLDRVATISAMTGQPQFIVIED